MQIPWARPCGWSPFYQRPVLRPKARPHRELCCVKMCVMGCLALCVCVSVRVHMWTYTFASSHIKVTTLPRERITNLYSGNGCEVFGTHSYCPFLPFSPGDLINKYVPVSAKQSLFWETKTQLLGPRVVYRSPWSQDTG